MSEYPGLLWARDFCVTMAEACRRANDKASADQALAYADIFQERADTEPTSPFLKIPTEDPTDPDAELEVDST